MVTPQITCQAGGSFYACADGSRFVGCCRSNPCTNGCATGNIEPSSFDAAQYGQFPDLQCNAGLYYTCVFESQNNATFMVRTTSTLTRSFIDYTSGILSKQSVRCWRAMSSHRPRWCLLGRQSFRSYSILTTQLQLGRECVSILKSLVHAIDSVYLIHEHHGGRRSCTTQRILHPNIVTRAPALIKRRCYRWMCGRRLRCDTGIHTRRTIPPPTEKLKAWSISCAGI